MPCDPIPDTTCIGKKRRERVKQGSYYQKCGDAVTTVLNLEVPGTGVVELPLCPNCIRKLVKNVIDCI